MKETLHEILSYLNAELIQKIIEWILSSVSREWLCCSVQCPPLGLPKRWGLQHNFHNILKIVLWMLFKVSWKAKIDYWPGTCTAVCVVCRHCIYKNALSTMNPLICLKIKFSLQFICMKTIQARSLFFYFESLDFVLPLFVFIFIIFYWKHSQFIVTSCIHARFPGD